ncbi:MAG: hypothetical protein ACFCU6_08845 [Balneolaceae bacterium]
MKKRNPYFIFLLVLPLVLFISCLDSNSNDEFETASFFSLTLNVTNIGGGLFDGQNTMVVESIKFTLRNVELERENQNNLNFGQGLGVASFSTTNTDDLTLGNGQVGQGLFSGIQFDISKPRSTDSITDTDLVEFTNGEVTNTFSIVVRGSFNDDNFVFRSDEELAVDLSFESIVNMPANNGLMVIRLLPNANNWFRDEQSRLINPAGANEEQILQISENIRDSFRPDVIVRNAAEFL